eukprot:m.294255 g.294255  ORF g.294255 m.294255 type:complete len:59 (-) comp27160_c0_seq10:632-808(-)
MPLTIDASQLVRSPNIDAAPNASQPDMLTWETQVTSLIVCFATRNCFPDETPPTTHDS